MSVEYAYVLPTDPRWVPGTAEEAAALALFGDFPCAELTVERDGKVQFYSAVEGFERASCPACSTVLFTVEDFTWFRDQIDQVWEPERGFWPLDVVTPCCGTATTLNDLNYESAQGFASWALRAEDPERDLDEHLLVDIEAALGHPVRVVWAHT